MNQRHAVFCQLPMAFTARLRAPEWAFVTRRFVQGQELVFARAF